MLDIERAFRFRIKGEKNSCHRDLARKKISLRSTSVSFLIFALNRFFFTDANNKRTQLIYSYWFLSLSNRAFVTCSGLADGSSHLSETEFIGKAFIALRV